MRVTVTGAAGTLGHAVAGMALRASHAVRAVVHRRGPPAGRAFDARIEVVHAEMLDRASVEDALAGTDAVIHCVDFPPSRYVDHWDALRHVLEALGPRGGLILPGNAWAFGPPLGQRITPGHPKKPAGKLASLRADLERAARSERGTVIHLPEVYGPGVRDGLCLRMIRRALAGHAAWVPGDLDRRIELLYIDDAARALLAPLGVVRARGSEYTAGCHRHLTPRELATLAAELTGHELRLRSLPSRLLRLLWRLHLERRHLQELLYRFELPVLLDGDRIRRDLGWEPEIGYEEGIRRTLKWFRGTLAAPKGPLVGRRLYELARAPAAMRSALAALLPRRQGLGVPDADEPEPEATREERRDSGEEGQAALRP